MDCSSVSNYYAALKKLILLVLKAKRLLKGHKLFENISKTNGNELEMQPNGQSQYVSRIAVIS